MAHEIEELFAQGRSAVLGGGAVSFDQGTTVGCCVAGGRLAGVKIVEHLVEGVRLVVLGIQLRRGNSSKRIMDFFLKVKTRI